jgi:hypothetical protein
LSDSRISPDKNANKIGQATEIFYKRSINGRDKQRSYTEKNIKNKREKGRNQ